MTGRKSIGLWWAGFASRGHGAARMAVAISIGSLLSFPASAHMGTGLPGGFVSGFKHPFSGTDHLLAMISVGLWGAFLGRPLIYLLPMIFPAMMVAGAIMAMFVVPMPPVEIGIALSVLVLGGCIASAFRAPIWAASFIVAVFAVFHGYAHGQELPSAADRRYGAIPAKVVCSWLIAVAILAATLQILPVTPGYLPDHLE